MKIKHLNYFNNLTKLTKPKVLNDFDKQKTHYKIYNKKKKRNLTWCA